MVVADEPIAARIGAEVLAKGGNAVDAAVATAFVLAVVEPTAGNLGGGGFMLVRMADGRAIFLDYRECAPRAASRDMYLDKAGNVVAGRSTDGLLAGGVPGTVLGMEEAMRRFGRLRWRDVVEPAVKVATEGFPISMVQSRELLFAQGGLTRYPDTKRIYFPNGRPPREGEIVRLPDLAATLRRIRDKGARDFYHGETARLIAKDMADRGGLITRQDLADYRVQVRRPIFGTYRGYDIVTAPPPSSGGAILVEMLNILEGFERPTYAQRIEAMRRAYANRSEFLGDPKFVDVPVTKLIDKRYAARLRGTIDADRATPSEAVRPGVLFREEHAQTTHFSVVDADGNCVANTYTLNGSFGSGEVIKGTGILLNNEMDDFTSKPGVPNMFGLIQGKRNEIQPGKRPLSSMTPTIVLRNGNPVLVLGSPGGSRIINTVFDVLTAYIDDKRPLPAAIATPRMHHQWMPDRLEWEDGFPVDAREDLARRGYLLSSGPRSQGICNAIAFDPVSKRRIGVADRRYGVATAAAER